MIYRGLLSIIGRARAKHSRSILLALDGSIEEKELENIQKEHLMRRCLEHMQTKSENQMKQLVGCYQNSQLTASVISRFLKILL